MEADGSGQEKEGMRRVMKVSEVSHAESLHYSTSRCKNAMLVIWRRRRESDS